MTNDEKIKEIGLILDESLALLPFVDAAGDDVVLYLARTLDRIDRIANGEPTP